MPGDVRTNLVLTAETKGLDKALQKTLGLNQKALDGLKQQATAYKKTQTTVKSMEVELGTLLKRQVELARSMEVVGDKGSDGYQKVSDELKKVKERAKEVNDIIRLQERAYSSESRAARQLEQALGKVTDQQQRQKELGRGAGAQGLVQGLGVGEYFQRGPGMGRQVAGRMIGSGVRRAAGAAWGMTGGVALTGVQGLQQAAAGVPLVGGAISGQLGAAAAYSKQSLEYQRQRLESLPYFGGLGGIQRATALQQKGPIVDKRIHPAFLKNKMINFTATTQAKERLADRAWAAQEAPFEAPAAIGKKYRGLSRQQALQEGVQFQQIAGGTYTEAPGQRSALGAAMAARTMYGVGYEATGAFQMAARRGGLAGGRGGAAENIRSALADAVKLGLGGSEINKYMQMVAQGIQQFQQTGIPMARNSLKDMAKEFGRGGMESTRALTTARGFQQMVQGVGARGPTGGLDLMLMQEFGGYTGRGGPEALEQTFIQMERMGEKMKGGGVGALASDKGTSTIMRRIIEMGGGGAGGRMFLRRQLAGRGINVGAQEMAILGKQLEGVPLSKTETAIAARPIAGGRGPGATVAEMMQNASQTVRAMGPNLEKQALIMDKQLTAGTKLVDAIQSIEMSAVTVTDAFTTLAGPTITKLMESIEGLTNKFNKALSAYAPSPNSVPGGSYVGEAGSSAFGWLLGRD